MIPINLSNEPRIALCSNTGVALFPSSFTKVDSNLSGKLKSNCKVPHCQSRPIASVNTKSNFGP